MFKMWNKLFPEVITRGCRYTTWEQVCSLEAAFLFANGCKRSREKKVRCASRKCHKSHFFDVLRVSNLRVAWQAWHFVTCGRVWRRVENRFSWQAHYFCDVVKRCVTCVVLRRCSLDVSDSIFCGRRKTANMHC